MSERIEPALSVDDWDNLAAKVGDFFEETEAEVEDGVLRLSHWMGDGDGVTTSAASIAIPVALLSAVVALANHMLPDGHPGKVTRGDVEAARAARDFCRSRHLRGYPELDHLSAKLAALLPGEGS